MKIPTSNFFTIQNIKSKIQNWMSGLWVSVVTLAIVELLSKTGVEISNPAPIYLTTVVYSAFKGGLVHGSIGAALSILYSVYLVSKPDRLGYTNDNGIGLIILSISALAIALMVGLLKQQADKADELSAANRAIKNHISRQQAEDALQESDSWLRRLVDANMFGIIVAEFSGKIIEANEAFANLLGYSREELLLGEINFLAITPPEYRHLDEQAMAEMKQTGKHTPFEKEYIRKDGSRVPVLVGTAYINSVDEIGIGFLIDLSDRQRSERSLQQLTNQVQEQVNVLNSILSASVDNIYIIDAEGRYRYVSAGGAQVLGFKPSDLVGKTWRDLGLPADVMEPFDAQREQVISSSQPLRTETKFISGDRTLQYEYIIAPLLNHEQSLDGIVVISRDVTEQQTALSDRQKVQKALEASEERYRAFIEQSSEAIWRFELEQPLAIDTPEDEQIQHFYQYGYLAECNYVLAQMYGFSSLEEIVGIRLGDLVVPSDPHNIEYLRNFIRSGYRLSDAESHEVDKHGNLKYFLNNLIGIVENGFLIRSWGTQRDITLAKQAEEALRRSEARFRRLAQANVIGIAFCRSDGTVTEANDAYLKIIGRSREELLKNEVRWNTLTPPEQNNLDEWALQQLNIFGECPPYEKEYIRKNGDRIPILSGAAILPGGDNEIVSYAIDLSERKKAEAALKTSQERLKLAQKAAKSGTFEWNIQTNEVFWTEELEVLYGLTPGSFNGKYESWREIVHPEDLARIESEILQVTTKGTEFRIFLPDGSLRWIAVRATVFYDRNDRPLRMIGVNMDITERKQAEEALQTSERRFRRLVESNIFGVAFGTFSGGINYANDYFLKMVGYDREDLRAGKMQWDRMTPPELLYLDDRAAKELIKNGVSDPFEKEYIRKDGSRVPILIGGALLQEPYEEQEEIIAFYLDLTERKQAQEALRLSEAKFRRLADSNIVGVIIANFAGKIIEANDAFLGMMGYTREELAAGEIQWREMTPPEYQPQDEDAIAQIKATGSCVPFEKEFICKDGTRIPILLGSALLEDSPDTTICFVLDLSDRKQAEAALRLSEARFRHLYESNIIGLLFTDDRGYIADANDAFLNIIGYTRQDLLAGNVHWHKITAPEYVHLDQQAVNETKLLGYCNNYEKEYIRKDGSRVPVIVGKAALEESKVGIGFVLDLTERKRAEEALHQREAQLRLITNALPALIAYIDLEQRYRFVNKGYEDWFGHPASAIYGKQIHEVVGELAYKAIRPYIETVLSGQQVTFDSQIPYKDGGHRYVSATYVPQFNNQGQVEAFVALVSDISDRKLAEEALKESEERFRKLAEKARIIPWEADAQTAKFTYVGPQTVDILGYPLEEWYTDNFWVEHMNPEDREWAVNYCIERSLFMDNYEFEYRMLAADGRTVWLYDIVNVVRQDRQPQILRGFLIDITARKLAEQEREHLLKREQAARAEAEAANRMKDEFLATLSHELRTPLNSMLGWTHLLRNRKFDEKTSARALETIDRNTKSLAQLIEDVLDVSRIITGKLRLNIRSTDVIPVIESAIETVRPAAEAKEIRIQSILDTSVGLVLADSNRLQQVIWNLLSNAIKFTPKKGLVEIKLLAVMETDNTSSATENNQKNLPIDNYVQIQIKDTGCGISPEFLPFVFERFRQADSTTTRSHGGLGLGLAIVRHLVELHGGTVCAQSQGEGQGATFIVNLPLIEGSIKSQPTAIVPSQSDSTSTALPSESLTPPSLDGLRILIVDDEADARELLMAILTEYGAEVIVSTNANEAVEMLQRLKPNLLVSDIGMPTEDGYSLIRQVRALSVEQGGRIPAIALTAYARASDRTQALLAGFQLHVSKPVNGSELAAAIANLSGRNPGKKF